MKIAKKVATPSGNKCSDVRHCVIALLSLNLAICGETECYSYAASEGWRVQSIE